MAEEQMIIALGVADKGIKKALDVIQSSTENSRAIKEMLSGIIDRGLGFEDGILVVIDGSKGIHKAVKEAFGECAIIQRCQWHKRENVIGYLKDNKYSVHYPTSAIPSITYFMPTFAMFQMFIKHLIFLISLLMNMLFVR